MASSLLNQVDNFADEVHKTKCKNCNYVLEYESVNYNLRKYNCLSCNKCYSDKKKKKIKIAI